MIVCLALLYTAIIIYLIWKIIDINKNPQKYNVIPGYADFQHSSYFWRLGRFYEKNDLPGRVWPSTLFLAILIPAWWNYSLNQINLLGIEATVDTFVYAHPMIIIVYVVGLIPFSLIILSYLALFSSHPRDICYTIFQMTYLNSQPSRKKKTPRSLVWKRWTLCTLFIALLFFPIRLWLLGNGGYIDETKLVYVSCFGLREQIYYFDELVIDRSIDQESGDYLYYYIVNPTGEYFDLCDENVDYFDNSRSDIITYIEGKIGEVENETVYLDM